MDAQRFDAVVRALVARGSRRAVASAGMLGLLGTILERASASSRRRKPRRHNRTQAEGKKKKKARCVPAGGSCKKPKKGKARKCCAGFGCDAQTKQCTAPPTPPTPPTQSAVCPEGLVSCEVGCLPQATGCCQAGERPCNGACTSGSASCQEEFAACMAPVTADWYTAVEGCGSSCENEASETCHTCLTQVLEQFADPLARCVLVTQTDGTASRAARQRGMQGEAAPSPCDRDQRRICRLTAIASAAGQGTAQTLMGAMDGPIGALGGFLISLGQFEVDLEACERQFGCPGGECDPHHGVCCPSTGCRSYDLATQSCSRGCAQDSYCNAVTQTCVQRCKICLDYLVDGRYLPCGQVTNNCGEVLTCNSCKSNERCENRRCVPKTCARGRGTAAADDCCVPQTCAELGKGCGSWDDGCGGVIDCGGCTHLGANAFCDGSTGACSCAPRTFCYSGECGSRPDGCGDTIDCETECASQSRPNGYCDANGQCACRSDTCYSLGKTCGLWNDGCGHSLDCGPRELVCGTSADPICCATGHTCCAHGPDYWGLPSECCDWSVCNRYPGGAYKGCCPALQQCTEPDGSKACCPEGWTCRGGSSPNSTNCCIMSGQGHEVLHTSSSYCCSGELASLYPHVCK